MSHKLTDAERDDLRLVLTVSDPLGPTDARELANIDIAAELLFERQNAIYEELLRRSGIIVGRRGAGKTAFMNQLAVSGQYRYIVIFSAPDIFPTILGSIRGLFGEYPPLVEVTGHLWNILIWCSIFGVVLRESERTDARLRAVRDFANQIPFTEYDRAELVISKVIRKILNRIKSEGLSVNSPLELEQALNFGNTSFTNCLAIAQRVLRNGRRKSDRSPVLVLMDTLEEYRQELSEASHAVSGLLYYLGRQAENRGLVDVRFCLPVEFYTEWFDLSSNPMKDFSTQTVLHWHAGDLLRVIAHRASLYLQIADRLRYESVMTNFDINSRGGASAFCRSLLPFRLPNLNSVEEPTIAYILRHTQLLPRHVIDIFNRCLASGIDRTTGSLGPISENNIVRAVRECEQRICSDIVSAYKHKYPDFWDLCADVVPNLPRRFEDAELHRAYNRHAKSKRSFQFYEFKRMLLEAGVIGKETGKSTDIYHEAEFEYTVAGRLVLAVDDKLSLHPLFSGAFPAAMNTDREAQPVFPRGSDPDAP